MLTEHLLTLILRSFDMPAEITAGILALYQQGLLRLFLSVITISLIMLCVGVRKNFIEQSGLTIIREPVTVAASGVVAYALALALMVVFLMSVVGFPVSAVVFFITSFFALVGQAALSVMLGDVLTSTIDMFQSALIGAIIIEGLKYIPYVNWLIRYLLLPILALGVVTAGVSNGYIKKKFYPGRDGRAAHDDRAASGSAGRGHVRELILEHTSGKR